MTQATTPEPDGPTRVEEIAPGIHRLSTFAPDVSPTGFTFNQFLLADEEPLLFHTGHRSLFPSVRDAIDRIVGIERLRWITFGHVESDECGAMNLLLKAAPRAEVAHGALGCVVSVAEMADRPPRPLADGEVLELGTLRVRRLETPHVPHGWDAGLLYEETTGTLLCGDLFTACGDGPALTDEDPVGPAIEAEDMFGYSSLTPSTPATIERLAALAPRRLALMHGPSFVGDAAGALLALAADYRRRLDRAAA
ncbi:MAG: MBL fold metallo-hydrolase [Acidimicrobiia bacterium]|jgi:flavorubredoxin